MSIQEKLINIQSELKAPKGQYNSFGKYKYRNAEDILEAVKPLLAKEKLLLALTDEIVQVGDRHYVKATAKLFNDKENIEVTAYAREEENKKGMDGSQITGASSSYARKYALNGLFLIDDTKDSDTTNAGDAPNQGAKKNEQPIPNLPNAIPDPVQDTKNKKMDKIKLESLQNELDRTGVKTMQIVKEYAVSSLMDLNLEQYVGLMKRLEKVPTKQKTDLGL